MHRPRRFARLGLSIAVIWLIIAAFGLCPAYGAAAGPAVAPDRVPVLILDAGLGDGVYYITHWLGDDGLVAESGGMRLLTSTRPQWWGGDGSPDTYLLTSADASGTPSGAAVTPQTIAWALDQIATRNTVGKSVIVAQGATGLQARSYLQDLTDPKHAARADVVGLVLLGTPTASPALLRDYAELTAWEPYMSGSALAASDLTSASPLLASLAAGRLPAVLKVLSIQGVGSAIAGMESDGLVARQDSILSSQLAPYAIDQAQVHARATQAYSLRDAWFKQTKAGGRLTGAVDPAEVERLAPMQGYVTDEQTRLLTKKFYETWFSGQTPTTHISSRLVIDVSGSMAERLGKKTKIEAAKQAAKDFIGSLQSRTTVPGAVPEDLALIAFNTKSTVAAPVGTSPSSASKKVASLRAGGNTDMGKALQKSIDTFDAAPGTADKVVVLLSDGRSTAGMKPKKVLSGPVAEAKKRGVRIETIALGGVGEADTKFLKQIAEATGGSFHKADDLFALRRDFLRARYASLGTLGVDQQVDLSKSGTVDIGTVAPSTRLLELGIVPDDGTIEWAVRRNGSPVQANAIIASSEKDGVIALAMRDPDPGNYTVTLKGSGGAGKAQIFAVSQADAFKVVTTAAPPDDSATMLLIGVAVAGVLAIIVTVAVSLRKRGARVVGPRADVGSDDGGLEGGTQVGGEQ